MATIVIPNTVQIAVEMTASGQPVVNVLHFQHATGTFVNVADALNAMKAAWERSAGPLKIKPTAVTMIGYKYTNLGSLNGATGYLASSTAGGLATGMSTMASSALIKIGGGTRSRSGSGRIYHGPLNESEINTDGRTLNNAAVTAITSAYTTFRVEMETFGLALCVASRKNSTSSPATSLSVAPIIATQRRRQR